MHLVVERGCAVKEIQSHPIPDLPLHKKREFRAAAVQSPVFFGFFLRGIPDHSTFGLKMTRFEDTLLFTLLFEEIFQKVKMADL